MTDMEQTKRIGSQMLRVREATERLFATNVYVDRPLTSQQRKLLIDEFEFLEQLASGARAILTQETTDA